MTLEDRTSCFRKCLKYKGFSNLPHALVGGNTAHSGYSHGNQKPVVAVKLRKPDSFQRHDTSTAVKVSAHASSHDANCTHPRKHDSPKVEERG
jgi:hypothetical protein